MPDKKTKMEALLDMFDLLHDTIIDINGESNKWCEEFSKMYDSCYDNIKEAI